VEVRPRDPFAVTLGRGMSLRTVLLVFVLSSIPIAIVIGGPFGIAFVAAVLVISLRIYLWRRQMLFTTLAVDGDSLVLKVGDKRQTVASRPNGDSAVRVRLKSGRRDPQSYWLVLNAAGERPARSTAYADNFWDLEQIEELLQAASIPFRTDPELFDPRQLNKRYPIASRR